jgi:hypothetical protein
MPRDTKEPQSYGSQADWTTGRTGEQVNDQKSVPPPEHAEFYDDRRESEESTRWQGGRTSPVQLAESVEPRQGGSTTFEPATKTTVREGGAKRGSYFKNRDYGE